MWSFCILLVMLFCHGAVLGFNNPVDNTKNEPTKPGINQVCDIGKYSSPKRYSICYNDIWRLRNNEGKFLCTEGVLASYNFPLYLNGSELYTRNYLCLTAMKSDFHSWNFNKILWDKLFPGNGTVCEDYIPALPTCGNRQGTMKPLTESLVGPIPLIRDFNEYKFYDSCYTTVTKSEVKPKQRIQCAWGSYDSYKTYQVTDIVNSSRCIGPNQVFSYYDVIPHMTGYRHTGTDFVGGPATGASIYLDLERGSMSDRMTQLTPEASILLYRKLTYKNCQVVIEKTSHGCYAQITRQVKDSRLQISFMPLEMTGIVQSTCIETKETYSINCQGSNNCDLFMPFCDKVQIMCQDGSTNTYTIALDIYTNCPLSGYSWSRNAAVHVCRMTSTPYLMYVTIVFWILGWFIIKGIIYLMALVIGLYRVGRYIKSKVIGRKCNICSELMENQFEVSLHSSCVNNVCPYCSREMDASGLCTHAPMCTKRLKEKLEAKKSSAKLEKYVTTSPLKRAAEFPAAFTWVITSILLTIACIQPVTSSNSSESLVIKPREVPKDYLYDLEQCTKGCMSVIDKCICYSDYSSELAFRQNRRSVRSTKSNKTSHHAPTIASTLVSNTNNRFITSLSWTKEETEGDLVLLTGISKGEAELISGSRIIFEISHPKAEEKHRLQISFEKVVDHYSWDLQYLTTNRRISSHHKGICTGECQDDDSQTKGCSCGSLPGCLPFYYTAASLVGRVPAWCWAINRGCQCCALQATPEADDIIAVWSPQYEKTSSTVCISDSAQTISCQTIDSITEFEVDGIKFSMTRPVGRVEYLKSNVVTRHKRTDGFLNLYSSETYIKTDICSTGQCKHGTWGDLQTRNPRYLMEPSSYSNKKDAFSFNFGGVSVRMTTQLNSWMSCQIDAVVDILPRFDKTSKGWVKSEVRFSKSPRSRINQDSVEMVGDFERRGSGGQISYTLEIKGKSLHLAKFKPELSKAKLADCHGCLGCHTGIDCVLTLKKETQGDYMFTVDSKTPGLVFTAGTYQLNGNVETEFHARAFAAVNVSSFEFCIKPGDVCGKTDLTLTAPSQIYVPEYGSLLSTSKNDCSGNSWVECLYNGKSFLYGEFVMFLHYAKYGLVGLALIAVGSLISMATKPLVMVKELAGPLIDRFRPINGTEMIQREMKQIALMKNDLDKIIKEMKEDQESSKDPGKLV